MKFKQGCTRYVVLHGGVAIKIAKIRPLRLVTIPLQSFKQGRLGKTVAKHKHSPFRGFMRCFAPGVLANRFERRCFECDEFRDVIAQTSTIFLWGLIAIQERGESVVPEEAMSHPFWQAMVYEVEGSHVAASTQFARFPNESIKLVDFGLPEMVCPALIS